MIPIRATARQLKQLLRDASAGLASPESLRPAWAAFRTFAVLSVETSADADSDGILYQSGVFAFGGPERYYVDLVRQFDVVDGTGEHDHYEQVHLRAPVRAQRLPVLLDRWESWWFVDRGEPFDAFVSAVEARPEFVALADVPPLSRRVSERWSNLAFRVELRAQTCEREGALPSRL
jgi:hypothetical protein